MPETVKYILLTAFATSATTSPRVRTAGLARRRGLHATSCFVFFFFAQGYATVLHLPAWRGRSDALAERGGVGGIYPHRYSRGNPPGPPPQAGGGDEAPQAGTRAGSSTIEKCTPALWRLLSRPRAALLGLLAGLERTFDLGRCIQRVVEVSSRNAANHPEMLPFA